MFKKYDGYLCEVKRTIESRGIRIKNKSDMEPVAFLSLMAETIPGAFWLGFRELFHFGLSHKTFYVPAELASALAESTYDFDSEDLASIKFPYPSFDVAVEPFQIDGIDMDAFMVIPPMSQASYESHQQILGRFLSFCSTSAWKTRRESRFRPIRPRRSGLKTRRSSVAGSRRGRTGTCGKPVSTSCLIRDSSGTLTELRAGYGSGNARLQNTWPWPSPMKREPSLRPSPGTTKARP